MTNITYPLANTQNNPLGLFLVDYQIGAPVPGGVSFRAGLTVNAPQETVQGTGQITQAINPPLNITSQLNGNFTYMTVMPNNSKILVTATGYPSVHMPPHSGIGPVIPADIQLQMVLESDWRSGTANYKYRTDINSPWISVNNAPVTALNINQAGANNNQFSGNTQLLGGIQQPANTQNPYTPQNPYASQTPFAPQNPYQTANSASHAQGFFGKEPVNPAQTTAVYIQQPGEQSGLFVVEAGGDAPNYSYGFALEREEQFVGGLKINVTGCTGPLGQGTTPYKVAGVFKGGYTDKIVLSASNGDFLIDVIRADIAAPAPSSASSTGLQAA